MRDLEQVIAALEQGYGGIATSTGMAAVCVSACMHVLVSMVSSVDTYASVCFIICMSMINTCVCALMDV